MVSATTHPELIENERNYDLDSDSPLVPGTLRKIDHNSFGAFTKWIVGMSKVLCGKSTNKIRYLGTTGTSRSLSRHDLRAVVFDWMGL